MIRENFGVDAEDQASLAHPGVRSRCIKYSSLFKDERDKLRRYCVRKFQRSTSTPNFSSVVRSLKTLFNPRRPCVSVSRSAFRVLSHIKAHGLHTVGIFRISGDYRGHIQLESKMRNSEEFDIGDYDMHTLASALKRYIREGLDGLVPSVVADALLDAYRAKEERLIKSLLAYFPFTLDEDRRVLMLEIFDLLRAVDKNSEKNLMPMKNLLLIFPPTVFPSQSQRSIGDFLLHTEIMEGIFRLDYENVSIEHINRE